MTNGTNNATSYSIQIHNSAGLLSRLKAKLLGDNPIPFVAGSSCCASSINMADSFVSESLHAIDQTKPEEANLLVVHGVITKAQIPYLKKLYVNLQEPKNVIAYGACCVSGAVFGSIALEEIIPVDFYVPGCPPTVNAFIEILEKARAHNREFQNL